MDRGRRMTIGYVMNKILGTRPFGNVSVDEYVPEIYKGFERYNKAWM